MKIIIQNADIKVCIHLPINLACIVHPIPQYAIKQPSLNFNVTPISLSLKPSPSFFYTHFLPFDHLLTILHSPMWMANCKVKPCLPMTFRKQWPFPLYHSLHPSLFQVSTSSLSRKRLIGNVLKSFSNLDSIFSLFRHRPWQILKEESLVEWPPDDLRR